MKPGDRESTSAHARLLRRTFAGCTDAIILGLILFAVPAVVQLFFSAIPLENRGYLLLATLSFVGLCSFPGMESSPTQGTLEKRLCGIKVTDLRGGRISGARALGRNLLKLVFFVLFPLSVVMIVRGARMQSIHDRLAGTQVLRRT